MTTCGNLNITTVAGASILKVTALIITPTSIIVGDSVTFKATVTNSGTAPGAATVTFYDASAPTYPIAAPGTPDIPAGGTYDISVTKTTAGWATGTLSICAKTNTE